MTLRQKTLLVVGLVLTTFIFASYFISRVILLDSYQKVEDDRATVNVQRLLNTISDDLEHLSATAADWGYWDDTYLFLQNRNDAYTEDNLNTATLVNLNINMMLFVDTSGELFDSIHVDLQTEEETPLPDSITNYILTHPAVLHQGDKYNAQTGIFQVPEGTILFASRSILTSSFEEPSQGTIILAYYLDDSRIAMLSETLSQPLKSYRLDDQHRPLSIREIETTLSPSNPIWVAPINSKLMAGYALLSDIDQKPILVMQMDTPRDIYQQGKTSLLYLLGSLLVVGIASLISVLWLIEKFVLSRLTILNSTVSQVRETGSLSMDIPVSGNDELSNLAISFKQMLRELAQVRHKLEQSNTELDNRVTERTAELWVTNVKLHQEIAERQHAQMELAQARDQALDALRLKSQILANVSHDARTPLNVITLMVEMLQSGRYGELTEKQARAIERINIGAQDLLGFINNMLEGARLDGNNRIVLARNEFSPTSLINEVTAIMRPLAERKGLQLETGIESEMPDPLLGDFEKIKQILANLVNNAIKFTTSGTVKVCLYCYTPTHWAIDVSDTGLGISAKDQENIFNAFWQVDGSMTREANRGVGLGLSIVKQLVALMGGEIRVRSELNKGSTFTVVLPILELEKVETEHA